MLFRLVCLLSLLFGTSALADDYDYPDKPQPKPDSYDCSLVAEIIVDEKFNSRREAQARCRVINELFSEGCSVERVGRRSYRAYFKKSWTFEASSDSWQDARWIVLEDYTDFAYKRAFIPNLPHSLTFSQCGEYTD